MKNIKKSGQALVEFVIILPVFIFMILAVIDLGKIMYFKNNLESKMDDVITSYNTLKNKKEVSNRLKLNEDQINLRINKDEKYVEFQLERELDIITPGLNLVFRNPYPVNVKRVIYDEA